MRTLVTGISGFTGCYIQSELEVMGHTVVGLSSDLTDPGIAQVQPEAVVHLAGISFVKHGNANEFYKVNLIGTRNLLDAIAKNATKIRCILLASSANVYGNRSERVLTEDNPPDPANDYVSVVKLLDEFNSFF